jgi:hypothetical protein
MKKIVLLLMIALSFNSCCEDDCGFDASKPELFTGKYYYLNNEGNCENDFLEFLGSNYFESNCNNEDRVYNVVTFSVLNNSLINLRDKNNPDHQNSRSYTNDYLKITLMNDGTYQFIKSVDGMVLQDLIRSDGSVGETWYMERKE